jgi:hypothetical protein
MPLSIQHFISQPTTQFHTNTTPQHTYAQASSVMDNFCYQLHNKQLYLFESMVNLRFNLANVNMAMVPIASFIKHHMELFKSNTTAKAVREPNAVVDTTAFEWFLDAGQEQVLLRPQPQPHPQLVMQVRHEAKTMQS